MQTQPQLPQSQQQWQPQQPSADTQYLDPVTNTWHDLSQYQGMYNDYAQLHKGGHLTDGVRSPSADA